MIDKEVLSNIIDKAIANGYDYNDLEISIDPLKESDDYLMFLQSHQIIFSHDFAKAFWGKDQISEGFAGTSPAWQYHLREMVLEENPIEYLEKFL